MMKKQVFSKGFLTMMSILSVLLGFALLCGGALAALHYFGVFSFSELGAEIPLSSDVGNSDPDFPIYTNVPNEAVAPSDSEIPEALMMELPFINTYYIKVEVSSDVTDGVFADGIYEIWRNGDKYRIHRYSSKDHEVEYIMICDGIRVQMQDFVTASITYADYAAPFAFSEVAPLPNFRKLFTEEHRFTEYREDGDVYVFSCEYPALSVTDNVEFSKSTGMISYYHRLYAEKALLSVKVTAMDTDRLLFGEYIFAFD